MLEFASTVTYDVQVKILKKCEKIKRQNKIGHVKTYILCNNTFRAYPSSLLDNDVVTYTGLQYFHISSYWHIISYYARLNMGTFT